MVENQTYLFIVFSLTGIEIGILFDLFRSIRKNFKTSNIITYIEDVTFWILTGILILYNIWYFNNGEIRLFMFLGIIMGLLIYILTLSNLFIKLTSLIINILKKIFSPFLSILRKMYILIKNFLKNSKKMINFKDRQGNLEKNGE